MASDGSGRRDRRGARRAGATSYSICRASASSVPSIRRHGRRRARSSCSRTPTRWSSRGPLRQLVSNFADERVGGVAANVVRVVVRTGGRCSRRGPLLAPRAPAEAARGPGRSVVSASGHQRCAVGCFPTGTDLPGGRLPDLERGRRAGAAARLDEEAHVLVATPEEGGTELRRRMRVMNRGLRSALRSAPASSHPHRALRARGGVPQAAAAPRRLLHARPLASSVALAAADPIWWLLLGRSSASTARRRRRPAGPQPLGPAWPPVPYFFCLANLAAALAVLSLLAGVRFEIWEPVPPRGVARS